MSSPPALSVIMFAYNEADNVDPVLRELRTWLENHRSDSEILFVDDGSTDASAQVAQKVLAGFRHRILVHDGNRGIGASMKTGTRAARSDWVTFLPADGQIAPASLGTLLAAQEASGADVVFSVYADRDDGLRRKILSAGVRFLIRVTQWTRLQSDGPYLFRRILFDADALHADSFFLNFEFPIRAITSGAATTVVSIPCQPRRSGESKSANLGKIVHVTRDLLALGVRRTLERLGG